MIKRPEASTESLPGSFNHDSMLRQRIVSTLNILAEHYEISLITYNDFVGYLLDLIQLSGEGTHTAEDYILIHQRIYSKHTPNFKHEYDHSSVPLSPAQLNPTDLDNRIFDELKDLYDSHRVQMIWPNSIDGSLFIEPKDPKMFEETEPMLSMYPFDDDPDDKVANRDQTQTTKPSWELPLLEDDLDEDTSVRQTQPASRWR